MTTSDPFSVKLPLTSLAEWRFSCKEMYAIPGYPATCGHPAYAAFGPEEQSSVLVDAFVKAGASLMGKTHQSELAFSALGHNPHYPMPRNAVNGRWVPGGSSSGCAVAVARGLVDFSLGTDTAGSVRIPAACNGVWGLSLAGSAQWLVGAVVLSPFLDQPGILASSLDNLRRAVAVVWPVKPVMPRRLLVPWGLVNRWVDRQVREQFRRSLARLAGGGLEVVGVSDPFFGEMDRLGRQYGSLALAEIAQSLGEFIGSHPGISAAIVERLKPYLHLDPEQIQQQRDLLIALARQFRQHYPDPVVLPTLACAVPRWGRKPAAPLGVLTRYANLLQAHSLSWPQPEGGSLMLMHHDLGTILAVAGSL
jgi:aspartyl-tRNA(Asn)/glutamyl-tRNA(Gln) amidotransferase subunit A